MQISAKITTIVLANTLLFSAPSYAESKRYPFAGFYASGVTPEAVDRRYLKRKCMLDPIYIADNGRSYFFRLDLPYFRLKQKLRFRQEDAGYVQTFDKGYKVIVSKPTAKFDGNPYYAPKTRFNLVLAQKTSGYTYVSFRSLDSLKYALGTNDLKNGDRGAMIKCPYSRKFYLNLAEEESTLLQQRPSERAENFELAESLKQNELLLKQVESRFPKVK